MTYESELKKALDISFKNGVRTAVNFYLEHPEMDVLTASKIILSKIEEKNNKLEQMEYEKYE